MLSGIPCYDSKYRLAQLLEQCPDMCDIKWQISVVRNVCLAFGNGGARCFSLNESCAKGLLCTRSEGAAAEVLFAGEV